MKKKKREQEKTIKDFPHIYGECDLKICVHVNDTSVTCTQCKKERGIEP